jgi:hypothetical protein
MTPELCFRLTARIRHLGYSLKQARHFVRFLVVCMMLVCAFMDMLQVPGEALWEGIEGSDSCAADPFDVTVLPAAYSIHR